MLFFSAQLIRSFVFYLFVDLVDYINRLANVEPSLFPRDKSYLVLVGDSLNKLLDLINQNDVEDDCSNVHQQYRFIVLFFGGVLPWFGDKGDVSIMECVLEHCLFFFFLTTCCAAWREKFPYLARKSHPSV